MKGRFEPGHKHSPEVIAKLRAAAVRQFASRPTVRERFDKYAPKGDPSKCWEWTGTRTDGTGGYGVLGDGNGRKGKNLLAHRLAWEYANGPIPGGLYVLHRCDNRPCVNPAHLFLGTHLDNIADMVAKGRHARQRKAATK